MSGAAAPRTAIINAAGDLVRVVFTSDLAGEDLTDSTTVDCPDEYPGELEWDVATQDFVAPPPPPPPLAPWRDRLLDILALGRLPTAEEIAELRLD